MSDVCFEILLVEDNHPDALLMQELLAARGPVRFELTCVRTLGAAIEELDRRPFDVVLLDLGLPDSFGPGTFARVHHRFPDLPVIVLTGLDDEEVGANLVKLGAQDFMVKWQLTTRELTRAIRYAIERGASERALRKARVAAEEASRAKSDFLAAVSHEIRTPMNSILGMTELLLETPLSDDQSRYASICKRAGEVLLGLIDGVLDLAKIEAGELPLDTCAFDPTRLLRDTVEILGFSAREKGLRLRLEIDPTTPQAVLGDPERVRQVLVNLVGNAIKFTDAGEVVLKASPIEPDVARGIHFEIGDTGPGVSSERIDGIFERFDRGDPALARQQGGTGLGLALARGLAERMGGRLWAESTPGVGSVFHFSVPLEAAPHDSVPMIEAHGEGAPPNGNGEPAAPPGLRVLLVDDSEDNRLLAATFLAGVAADVDQAETGEQAVERFRGGLYDVVLMDVHMPGMDGYEATRAIRRFEAEQGRARTPIIALTAFAFEEERSRSLEAGCDAHLSKPISKQRLLEAVTKHAAGATERVRVDPEIRGIVDGFLANRRRDVDALLLAVGSGDFPTIRTLGHNMKGSGRGYGFDVISEIGAELDRAARQLDLEGSRRQVARLAHYVERVRVVD